MTRSRLPFNFRDLSRIRVLLRPSKSLDSDEARAWDRQRRIILTSITFAIYRGISLLFPILTISLFLKGLGKEVYGVLMTVTSFFALFSFADLGLGFGLLTHLSQAHGKGDERLSRSIISSAFFMLSIISGFLILLTILVFPFLSWGDILNTTSTYNQWAANWIAWIVVIAQLLQIPLSLVQRTQLALQEGYVSNLWQCAGVVVNLIVVSALVYLRVHPLMLVAFASAIPLLAIFMNGIHFFGLAKPSLRPTISMVQIPLAKTLLLMSGGFFLLQILLSLGLSIDNLVVARVCGVSQVTDFSIASRVAAVIGGVVSMLSMPMWAANGDAFARGDYAWIRRSCLKLAGLSFALSLAASMVLVIFGPWIFEKWLGKQLHIEQNLLLYCAFRESLLAIASPFFMVLNGAGIIWPQIRIFFLFTILATGLKIFLAKMMGSQGVALGNAILYLSWILPWVIYRARTAWTKNSVNF